MTILKAMQSPIFRPLWALLLCSLIPPLHAREVRVAVASNFAATAEALTAAYVQEQGNAVQLSSGATGMHYAQIMNGAPFDVWLAADSERPARLEQEGRIVAGTRATYALGSLVIWSPQPLPLDDAALAQTLRDSRVAIANPDVAPYGQAAEQTLRSLGLWEALEPRLVRGQNVAQAFQFVVSGNADIGFVAAAQLSAGPERGGNRRVVPAELYTPIEQQRVLLNDTPEARSFIAFLDSAAARATMLRHGYSLPE